jgi:poly(3-hydroxybutyrate) depolymerase
MFLNRPSLVAIALVLAGCSSRAAAPALPALDIDPQRVAVAGLSSGAYMATQTHLALSDRIHGAALIAGGPYGCAGGDLNQALGPCMAAQPQAPDVQALLARVRERAQQGGLAALSNLSDDRVMVIHGRDDLKVAPVLGAAALALYEGLAADAPGLVVKSHLDGAFGHLLPKAGEGDECANPSAPYVGRCGYDAAGEVFAALFGAPAKDVEDAPTGELHRFDQQALRGNGPDPLLGDEGFLYLPPQCADGQCGLLIAFHGCQQNAEKVGEAFVREGGFNRWADAFDVAVLYPQTRASFAPLNPNACWDWWGYSGAEYDTRSGAQLQWLSRVLDALTR